ncbi:hypothetical protein RBG61_06915 [Paludicola sp. MB14-C6]|uniref:hypothetical protein n=1 Tax=Paludihabitans sp. MB14-C6 TaxID=3070656 RepID=UPI0027DDD7E3|nr:hypothetical protein [Paludicola sp. MB14-C6]WMJ24393.1 hypothetical protein RBG61_06915 [Paludicola sp. MB14-C6]
MIKKIITASLIVGLCFSLVGCKSVKGYSDLNKAQENMMKQNSCHMVISSSVNGATKADANVTDFVYKLNDKGVMEYCQSQQDASNKMVFCEVSDGEKTEQWLLGNGWSNVDATAYTKDNPHRYLQLISGKIDKKNIAKMDKKTDNTNTIYNVAMDAKKLNKTVYKDADITVKSQNVSFTVNKKGELICYNDKAVILDKESNVESEYALEVQLTEHNGITEIKKPDLQVKASANATLKTSAKK